MTATATKLKETPVKKLFLSYLIPSVFGMLLMSVNIVLDGIFVSRGVGPNGLAAINISMPAFSLILAISLWIGTGGATIYSISLGKNELAYARSVFSQSILFCILLTGAIMGVCIWKIDDLAWFLGSNEIILPYVMDYLQVILVFGIVIVLENALSIFVRNDGNPTLAMAGLVVSAVLNIILNYVYIFIFGWGVKGAAYATVIATTIGFLVLLAHFFRKSSSLKWGASRFQCKTLQQILTIGFPGFASEMSVAVVTFGLNVSFMRWSGETGVAAYSIVNYIHALVVLVFLGVGGALQPIASFHYGARLYDRLHKFLRLSVQTAMIIGLIAVVAGWCFPDPLVTLFGVKSQDLYELTVNGIAIFFINYLFLGFNLVYGAFYQSVGQVKKSIIIILSRGIFFVLPLLWILPHWFGLNGIWLAIPAAEALAALMILGMNYLK
ncbi:MAG: MATE family efflux transporter, partial [Desulfotomaculaceae bacterium]|nr:MATE family efflux transporter [Desulfotomaculaceae bacterium]